MKSPAHSKVNPSKAGPFAPIKPMMHDNEAVIEASRCLFCHDAPCIIACPTSIDIPMFIRQIMSHNATGAAETIFSQNILGKSCGQVCPTEVLCEGSCVYLHLNEKPIDIGRLQAYATQQALTQDLRFFEKGPSTGKRVAIVGGGPAGLACAHELTRLGHEAVVYESSAKAGGLNSYGVAPYKLSNADADEEVAYIQGIGFEIKTGIKVTTNSLSQLEAEYDAVFLGIGLGASRTLGITGENLPGVYGASEWIYQLRANNLQANVGKRVVVVGAGNTAIDACLESAKLGAQVTLVYRRTEADQNAYWFEVDLAKQHGVHFEYLTSPISILGADKVTGILCIQNQVLEGKDGGKSSIEPIAGSEFTLPCDTVIFATGQEKQVSFFESISGVTVENQRVKVNAQYQTGNPKIFAGGDCVNGGKEVVNAVAHGRDAARGIHEFLTGEHIPAKSSPAIREEQPCHAH